jgi:hypothetical protein
VLLSPKRHAAIAAISSYDFYFHTVNKHGSLKNKNPKLLQESLALASGFESTAVAIRVLTHCHRQERMLLASFGNLDIDAATFTVEIDVSFDQGKNGVVGADANVSAWVPFRSLLANQNIAREHLFSAKLLDSEALCIRIASVASGALTLFVCHFNPKPKSMNTWNIG